MIRNKEKAIKKRLKPSFYVGKFFSYLILSLLGIIIIFPFLFALSTSFTSSDNIYNFQWIPQPIDVGNYVQFFSENNVFQALGLTFAYVIPVVFVGTFMSMLAAYAFARIKFKGSKIAYYAILATVVVPSIITLVPSYILFTNVYHWTGTPLPLIIPGMFGGALTMFFLTQYFKTLPKELEEAAQIDGMSRVGIFLKIIIPLSIPAIITQIILSFNGCYNDYLGPLLYLGGNEELYTIQLLVASIQTASSKPYTLMMAAAITALIPTFILYIFCQKYFVEGIAMTGLK